jgi:hypothetical protein
MRSQPPVTPDAAQGVTVRQSEKDFMQAVVDFAKVNQWHVYHTHDSRRSERGFPDLVCVRRGVIVFAELKVGRNRLSAAQMEWISALQELTEDVICIDERDRWCEPNIQVRVWRPEDWEEIESMLQRRPE